MGVRQREEHWCEMDTSVGCYLHAGEIESATEANVSLTKIKSGTLSQKANALLYLLSQTG